MIILPKNSVQFLFCQDHLNEVPYLEYILRFKFTQVLKRDFYIRFNSKLVGKIWLVPCTAPIMHYIDGSFMKRKIYCYRIWDEAAPFSLTCLEYPLQLFLTLQPFTTDVTLKDSRNSIAMFMAGFQTSYIHLDLGPVIKTRHD